MRIIQTKNKFTNTNMLKGKQLFVENVGMFLDIDYMQIPIHLFESYLLIYCREGIVAFEQENQTEMLHSGFIKIIPPDTYIDFSYLPEDNNEYYFIHFIGTLAKELVDCIFINKDIIYIGNRPDISTYFIEIEKSFEISKDDHVSRSLLLKNLFYTILKTQNQKNVKSIQNTMAISNVIIYIQNNYDKNISIEQLTKMCYISKDYFMRIFKEHTGYSAIDYITNIRIETAKKLLESSTYTISEISATVGYHNPLYFSRIFKNKTGVSPSAYKKKSINKNNANKKQI